MAAEAAEVAVHADTRAPRSLAAVEAVEVAADRSQALLIGLGRPGRKWLRLTWICRRAGRWWWLIRFPVAVRDRECYRGQVPWKAVLLHLCLAAPGAEVVERVAALVRLELSHLPSPPPVDIQNRTSRASQKD
jgi:hypothetical protein